MNIQNPTIYCELCNIGIHKHCLGLENIDLDFKCDLCVYTANRFKAGKQVFQFNYYKCIYCLKDGSFGIFRAVERSTAKIFNHH